MPDLLVAIAEGDQVPEISLVDVVGNACGELPKQNGPIRLNVGVVFSIILIDSTLYCTHWPAEGVNV